MAVTREEIAADLVWRYVERLRESEDPAAVALDRAELEQLVSALEAAGQVPGALHHTGTEAQRTAVRDRLTPLMAAPTAPVVPQPEPRRSFPSTVPAWQFRMAMAASLILMLLVTTVNGWHHTPAPVRQVPVMREARGLEPMDEEQAHTLIPVMLRNELSYQQERSLMGHMLVCTGCFEDYRAAKGSSLAEKHPGAHVHLASGH